MRLVTLLTMLVYTVYHILHIIIPHVYHTHTGVASAFESLPYVKSSWEGIA